MYEKYQVYNCVLGNKENIIIRNIQSPRCRQRTQRTGIYNFEKWRFFREDQQTRSKNRDVHPRRRRSWKSCLFRQKLGHQYDVHLVASFRWHRNKPLVSVESHRSASILENGKKHRLNSVTPNLFFDNSSKLELYIERCGSRLFGALCDRKTPTIRSSGGGKRCQCLGDGR